MTTNTDVVVVEPLEKKEEAMEFDEVLPIIGEFGLYQKTLDLMFCLMNLPVAYQVSHCH